MFLKKCLILGTCGKIKNAYDEKTLELAEKFKENFRKHENDYINKK